MPLCYRLDLERPALLDCEVAQKALDGMNAYRRIEVAAIAGTFARVITDTAMHRRHRVVAHQRFPCLAVLARLGQIEPRLNILSSWAGIVAWR